MPGDIHTGILRLGLRSIRIAFGAKKVESGCSALQASMELIDLYCTASPVDPVVPPEFAVMLTMPGALPCARPATLGAFAMVATLEDVELQWLFKVTSCVLLSLKVPVAMNC